MPIGGIKPKVSAATEKRINRLVLSKYQSSPHLLSEKAKYYPTKEVVSEDYQQVFPTEIKEKIQVNWAENISELKQLLLDDKLS